MLQRLYVNNFRCLENFELTVKGMQSALLLGKNGTGKSTVRCALGIFQNVGSGVNRVRELVNREDFFLGRSEIPIRLEMEALLDGMLYKYELAFDLPATFRELRVSEEKLTVAGSSIYSRREAQVTLQGTEQRNQAQFSVDWHLVALPVIHEQSKTDPLRVFKSWLSRMVILAPIPSLMKGDSDTENQAAAQDVPATPDGSNFADWFTRLLSLYPAAYSDFDRYVRQVMPDIWDVQNERTGKDSKSIKVNFKQGDASLSVYFSHLSDGEKCFFLCAVVLAANKFYGPLFCFWDEPDNYLSLSEVGDFVTSLRRSFAGKGQILVTSHHPEAIRRFSDENTFLLDRKSHMEPTIIRLLIDLQIKGDLVESLARGDIFDES